MGLGLGAHMWRRPARAGRRSRGAPIPSRRSLCGRAHGDRCRLRQPSLRHPGLGGRARPTPAGSTSWWRRPARLSFQPPGVMFGGARGRGLDFADIVVSIPPDSARQARRHSACRPRSPAIRSAISWSCAPTAWTWRRRRRNSMRGSGGYAGRRVLVFIHGFNTRFEEAVYRFAQIVHDARVQVAPVLFTWPSGGRLTDYVYDRDSALYSRDALEVLLQALVNDANVNSISILAHSMGNYIAMESLRQMSIRDRGLSPKIRDVMLASPDIDIDVFRRQIAEIDAGPRPADFTLFVSRDDRALGLSSFLARDSTRLGALDPIGGALSLDPGEGQGASRRPDHAGFQRLHQSRQIRQRRGRRRDWRAAGGGPVAERGQERAWSSRWACSPAARSKPSPTSPAARSPRRARSSIRHEARSRSTPRRKPRPWANDGRRPEFWRAIRASSWMQPRRELPARQKSINAHKRQ